QPYPAKSIRIINTTTAGGPAELTARLVGQKFTDAWGQQVVVDSRTGAGGRTRAVNSACGTRSNGPRAGCDREAGNKRIVLGTGTSRIFGVRSHGEPSSALRCAPLAGCERPRVGRGPRVTRAGTRARDKLSRSSSSRYRPLPSRGR